MLDESLRCDDRTLAHFRHWILTLISADVEESCTSSDSNAFTSRLTHVVFLPGCFTTLFTKHVPPLATIMSAMESCLGAESAGGRPSEALAVRIGPAALRDTPATGPVSSTTALCALAVEQKNAACFHAKRRKREQRAWVALAQ